MTHDVPVQVAVRRGLDLVVRPDLGDEPLWAVLPLGGRARLTAAEVTLSRPPLGVGQRIASVRLWFELADGASITFTTNARSNRFGPDARAIAARLSDEAMAAEPAP